MNVRASGEKDTPSYRTLSGISSGSLANSITSAVPADNSISSRLSPSGNE